KHVFAVLPDVRFAVDENFAGLGVGRHQAEMVAQRPGIRIAMGHQSAARQQREHRTVDRWDGLHQIHGPGTQRPRRWQGIVVPLQVEALPAGAKERIEAQIVVLFRGADMAFVEQPQALIAYGLPVLAQSFQFGKPAYIEQGLVRNGGKGVEKRVQRREDRRVISQLSREAVPDSAAKLDESGGQNVKVEQNESGREYVSNHVGTFATAASTVSGLTLRPPSGVGIFTDQQLTVYRFARRDPSGR